MNLKWKQNIIGQFILEVIKYKWV